MEFIHHNTDHDDTIAAVTTAPGQGGVAIIRISGKEAVEIADKIFSGPVSSYNTHTAHYGTIHNTKGDAVDDVLLLVMLGKRSYTGENTVEINCHGGSLITRRVLDVVLEAGARAAKPGEFTFRAFMNGKLDLAQAEAVQELIAAKNEHALNAAENQLQGALSEKILVFQKELTEIAAILEAWVDFPEEGLEFASLSEVCNQLEKASNQMQQLVDTFHDGKIIHDGLSLCLVGSPNVGKSSLMNALLEKDRAIVTDIPGTTRDILEDHMLLNGLNFKLIDTAGIRETSEVIEKEGIRRSHHAMQEADLILVVLDANKGLTPQDKTLLDKLPKDKSIVIWNKIDLPYEKLPKLDFPYTTSISAKKKQGLKELHTTIDTVVWNGEPPSKDEVLITNVRHKEAIIGAIHSCNKVITGLKTELSPEFVTIDMRQSLQELGKIIGTNISEDILTAIFSKFCIGK